MTECRTGVQQAHVRTVFLPRDRARTTQVRSARVEHSVRIQRVRSPHLSQTTPGDFRWPRRAVERLCVCVWTITFELIFITFFLCF